MSTRAEIRERVSVPFALEQLGLPLPARIPGHVHCFAHEEAQPSMWVEEDHWWAFCCGVGGDVVALLQFAGASLRDALRWCEGAVADLDLPPVVQGRKREVLDLTERFENEANAFLSGHQRLQAMQFAHELVALRWPNLVLGELLAWGVRVGPYNLLVPHPDDEGVIRGIRTRSLMGDVGAKRSVKGSTFTHRLYRVEERPEAPIAVICEGESDTWSLSKAYYDEPKVAVYGIPSGALSWQPHFAGQLAAHPYIVLALDTDRAGSAGVEKVSAAFERKVHRLRWPEGKDVTEAINHGWTPPVPRI